MFFACWNIRGLNDPLKQGEVRKLISEHKLSLCGLVETKVKEVNKDSVLINLARDWKAICNYQFDPRGGIWVCWNPKELDVSIIDMSDQVLHCKVSVMSSSWSCFVSVVYGENCNRKRESLWNNLSSSASAFGDHPWMVYGDFNAIRWTHERMGGSREWPSWMGDLDDCIISAGLFDLRFCGQLFTWSNRRDRDPILRKLDRVLVNTNWENFFPGSEAFFLPAGISDHSPMIVKLPDLPKVRKPSAFFNFWADHPNFLALVEDVWKEDIRGTPMFQLCLF